MIQSKELQIVLSSCLKDEMLKLKETLTDQDKKKMDKIIEQLQQIESKTNSI